MHSFFYLKNNAKGYTASLRISKDSIWSWRMPLLQKHAMLDQKNETEQQAHKQDQINVACYLW